jgi:predicted transcriptional regulator
MANSTPAIAHLIRPKTAASMLGISKQAVNSYIQRHSIPVYKIDGVTFLDRRDVEQRRERLEKRKGHEFDSESA